MQPEDVQDQEPSSIQDVGADQINDTLLAFDRPAPHAALEFAERLRLQPRVLIVDDDESIGILLKMVLENYNFDVRVVLNAEAAFSEALDFDPDIVLADYLMPGVDGTQLRARMQSDPRVDQIPFTLMSCRRQRLPSMQGVPFLPKPFDLSDVVSFVERHRRHEAMG